MGQDSSKGLSDKDLADIRQSTHFTQKEIDEWYDRFNHQYPGGTIPQAQFINMYEQMFPGGDARDYAEHIFRAYDSDGNGSIDFNEFMCTLSVSSKGTPDEKLDWAFKLYDRDGNGDISRDEAVDIICAIYKMRGEEQGRDKAQDTVSQLFMQLDRNKDSRLSKTEFMLGAQKCSAIMETLSQQ